MYTTATGCIHPMGEMEGGNETRKNPVALRCQFPSSSTRARTKNHSHSRHQAKVSQFCISWLPTTRQLPNTSYVTPSYSHNPYQPSPPVLCCPPIHKPSRENQSADLHNSPPLSPFLHIIIKKLVICFFARDNPPRLFQRAASRPEQIKKKVGQSKTKKSEFGGRATRPTKRYH